MSKEKKTTMKIVNEHCAGIDVGSRSHYVAIGQTDKDVKEFGVYAQDLTDLCNWLIENMISTVAFGEYRKLLAKSLCRTH
ncbi:MAG: hypothetical protein R2772_00265 [Chitinophagales bacterium]